VLSAVLFWLFFLSIAVQCGYALYFFTRIFNFSRQDINIGPAVEHVSVIICAKNEAENLEQNLPAILSQRYMNEAGKQMYEVIVVNDGSNDDTEAVLCRLEQQYSHLWHVTISEDQKRTAKGKKFALAAGVKYATYPWLVLTDADCLPASDNWLAFMSEPFRRGKKIVAGYGGHKHADGLLNAFIRWETMHTFLQYSTYALAGKPYMAVGRNLACSKEIFAQAQQSEVWNELPSGDDDLLMQYCATVENTTIVAHHEAFTYSDAKGYWRDWIRQKQRHMSTGKYYKEDVQTFLGVYAASHAASWILFFVLICQNNWSVILFMMAVRCSIYWTIWQSTALRLKDRNLLSWIPFCDVGWLVYNFILSPYILWKNKQKWK